MKECPVFQITGVVGKKWAVVVLQEVALNGTNGFNCIFKRIGSISPKILSARLKEFEEQELIAKELLNEKMPARTKYYLTKKGKALNSIITAMRQWCTKYDSGVRGCDERECVKCPLF